MQDNQRENLSDLQQAHATIERQATEIEQLRARLERESFATELRQLLIDTININTVLSPTTHSHLFELLVEMAMQVISARAGSLFLIDEATQELVFEVALGPEAQEVKRFRVPLGHGIVGLVAITGQPMAIANAQQDGRLAFDIASSINYIPTSVLCVPLYFNEQVIGALELLDKQGAETFNHEDMQLLGAFAQLATIAIAQSRAYHDQEAALKTLILHVCASGDKNADQKERQRLQQSALSFSQWAATEDATTIRARKLAQLLQELNTYGEIEGEMCLNVLNNLVSSIRLQRSAYGYETVVNRQERGI